MITKTDFLVYVEAPRHFWALKHNQYNKKLSDFDNHLIKQGYLVEEQAKEYAKRYLLPKYSSKPEDLIFQQTFIDGDFEARTDILIRNEKTNKYDVYEIKSVTDPKPEHYYDVTFQANVLVKHLDIENVHLIYVNRDYQRNGDFDLGQFFTIENVNSKILELQEETLKMMQDCQILTTLDNYKLATECYKPKECSCLELCHPDLPEYSIYDLSRITEKKIIELKDSSITSIVDIPEDYPLSANQIVQVRVAKNRQPLIDIKAIKQELSLLEYPLYFLDYETYNPAMPIYDKYKPYQQMVFQYSLHVLESPQSKQLKHYEYVENTKVEPSHRLLEHMSQLIGETGSVVVWYKAFEGARNKEMAELNPAYLAFLESVNSRIYDLMDIFKKNYCVYPNFKGSNSIKDVLPVLVPELSYKSLEIQNGAVAMISWHKMVYEDCQTTEIDSIYNCLCEYCKLDTYSMYKIWEYLNNLA